MPRSKLGPFHLAGIHKDDYKGYMLGWIVSPNGYRACWKEPATQEWVEGHILVDTIEETLDLAQECIDYNLNQLPLGD